MICSNCRHENRQTAKFCESCGNKLARLCPSCGVEARTEAKFCDNCGTKLDANPEVPPQAPVAAEKPVKKAAERRQLTVLFCDLVGSTALSEKLDAEDFRQIILNYQQVAEAVVKRHGGHIAQYLGDGLLVYFGYPQGLEDAPKAGIRAGLGILEAAADANVQWAAAGQTTIAIGFADGAFGQNVAGKRPCANRGGFGQIVLFSVA
jgi:Double zinc ribbon/Adenylate and Guanylate cyclase catalytic domain